MVKQVREELARPFWTGWTLKDFVVVGALVSTLAVDHYNISAIMKDVASIRAGMERYGNEFHEIQMKQQRLEDAIAAVRDHDAALRPEEPDAHEIIRRPR